MGEAPLEATSSREVTFEPESWDTIQSQEQEQEEEYEYTLSEEEDLEAARVEAEKQKYIFQQPATGPPPALKQSWDKGKQPQFQDYTQRSEDGNQTPTKDRSQAQTTKKNACQDSHSIGKSRTEASKKAVRTRKTSYEDSDDDPNSEGSNAGRDADRSGSENESDRETAAEESDRSVREITTSMPEWEKITGQKQRRTSAKTNKQNNLAKIRDPDNCDGKAEKCRDTITFDQYGQLIIKWLKWQEYDIKSEDALARASFLMSGC